MVFSLSNGFKTLISSSALIVRSEADGTTNRQIGLSGGDSDADAGSSSSSILDLVTRTEGGAEVAIAKTANSSIMDQAKPSMIKDADYVVDVILPTILIALLFVGNAVIVYIIFQYRKRKVPVDAQDEDIALSASSRNNPQV